MHIGAKNGEGQKTKGTPSDSAKIITQIIRDTFATKSDTAFEFFHTHDREPYITFPIGTTLRRDQSSRPNSDMPLVRCFIAEVWR